MVKLIVDEINGHIEEDKKSSIKDELSYEGVSHILYSDS